MAGNEDWLSERLRKNVRSLYQELSRSDRPKGYLNLEGGSVEQVRDLRLRFHHCANYAAALTILQERQGDWHLLELGCGSGALSFAFARVMPSNWHLLATDYSQDLIDYARNNRQARNLRFECVNINNLDAGFLNDIDGVMFLEVIEHLPQAAVRRLLFSLYQGLKPGGVVIVSTLDRSPFPRRFSGYPPHWTEYRYESLRGFLENKKNSPFEGLKIYRLGSKRVVSEAVRAENMGGYFVNRLSGMVKRFCERSVRFNYYQERLGAVLFRLYSRLPAKRGFDIEGYVQELHFIGEDEVDDGSSFSLIAVLRKKGR
ncbi:MAG: class I SAM-dependent methyltransferase [candidate division WOR-3 bacterium]